MDFTIFQGAAMGGAGGIVMAWIHIAYLKKELDSKNIENKSLRDELKEYREKSTDLAYKSIEVITLNNHLLSTKTSKIDA